MIFDFKYDDDPLLNCIFCSQSESRIKLNHVLDKSAAIIAEAVTSMKTGDLEVKKQELDSNILIQASTGKIFKVMC